VAYLFLVRCQIPVATDFELRSLDLRGKHVTRAWMAAIISGGLSLIYGLLSLIGVISAPGVNVWILLDAAILGGLAYGVWRRSRVCAILLVIYGIVNEVALALDENAQFSILRLVFLYFYIRGAIQIFRDRCEQFVGEPTDT
jgi:hypothetical protein